MAMEQTLKNMSSGPFLNPSAPNLRPGVRLVIYLMRQLEEQVCSSETWDFFNSGSIVGRRIDIFLLSFPGGELEPVFQAINVSKETADIIVDEFILPVLRRIVLLKGQDVDTVLWAVGRILDLERVL